MTHSRTIQNPVVRHLRLRVACAAVVLQACGSDYTIIDAAPRDTASDDASKLDGAPDSRSSDTGASDVETADALPDDALRGDTGPSDSGPMDAILMGDAELPDCPLPWLTFAVGHADGTGSIERHSLTADGDPVRCPDLVGEGALPSDITDVWFATPRLAYVASQRSLQALSVPDDRVLWTVVPPFVSSSIARTFGLPGRRVGVGYYDSGTGSLIETYASDESGMRQLLHRFDRFHGHVQSVVQDPSDPTRVWSLNRRIRIVDPFTGVEFHEYAFGTDFDRLAASTRPAPRVIVSDPDSLAEYRGVARGSSVNAPCTEDFIVGVPDPTRERGTFLGCGPPRQRTINAILRFDMLTEEFVLLLREPDADERIYELHVYEGQ